MIKTGLGHSAYMTKGDGWKGKEGDEKEREKIKLLFDLTAYNVCKLELFTPE